jgi:RNA polymerase sigma-70 factor (ECF subfamily)
MELEQLFYLLRTDIEKLDYEIQEMIYNSFYRFVYRDIYFLVLDHEATKDIIQESFLKMIISGPKTKHATNMKGWVKQVTRNTALDWLRKNKRPGINKTSINTLEEIIAIHELDAAKKVEDKLRKKLLHQTIAELKPDYRTLLMLYYFEEKSYKEISQLLQLSEQVIAQRLARARKKLYKKFSSNWNDLDE